MRAATRRDAVRAAAPTPRRSAARAARVPRCSHEPPWVARIGALAAVGAWPAAWSPRAWSARCPPSGGPPRAPQPRRLTPTTGSPSSAGPRRSSETLDGTLGYGGETQVLNGHDGTLTRLPAARHGPRTRRPAVRGRRQAPARPDVRHTGRRGGRSKPDMDGADVKPARGEPQARWVFTAQGDTTSTTSATATRRGRQTLAAGQRDEVDGTSSSVRSCSRRACASQSCRSQSASRSRPGQRCSRRP